MKIFPENIVIKIKFLPVLILAKLSLYGTYGQRLNISLFLTCMREWDQPCFRCTWPTWRTASSPRPTPSTRSPSWDAPSSRSWVGSLFHVASRVRFQHHKFVFRPPPLWRYRRRKLLDCICAILEYNVILQYRLILELSILYSSITATSGWEERGRVACHPPPPICCGLCVCVVQCTCFESAWRGGGGAGQGRRWGLCCQGGWKFCKIIIFHYEIFSSQTP